MGFRRTQAELRPLYTLLRGTAVFGCSIVKLWFVNGEGDDRDI